MIRMLVAVISGLKTLLTKGIPSGFFFRCFSEKEKGEYR